MSLSKWCKMAAIFSLVIIALWSISGCRSAATLTTDSPLATVSPIAETHSLPTPMAGYGVLGGRLVNQATGDPVGGRVVYLGNLLPLQPEGFLITMAEQNGVRTITDPEGYFVFPQVVSGTYALILWSPAEPQVLKDPATGDEYLIDVPEGERVDVGALPVSIP